jgi:hypothetical protein
MKHGISVKQIREQAVKDAAELDEPALRERAQRIGRYYANSYGQKYLDAALKAKGKS